jgi:Brp/Blh family beta-carotene 15,15'-monooxygenase
MIHIDSSIPTFRLSLTLACIGLARWTPELFNTLSAPLIVCSVILLVIPHGALDHIIFYQMYKERCPSSTMKQTSLGSLITSWLPQLVFYIHYLAIMLLWGLAWKYQITSAFLLFLSLSAYHFGEGDTDYIDVGPLVSFVLRFSRGVYLLSLIIFSQPSVTLSIIQKFMTLSPVAEESVNWFELCILQHYLLLFSLNAYYSCFPKQENIQSLFPIDKMSPNDKQVWLYELFKVGLFWCLFSSMNPLVAFTIYLGPWHSLGHILSEISYLKREKNSVFASNSTLHWSDIMQFLKLAAPLTTIALVSMTGAYIATCKQTSSISYDDIQAWTLFIISISILTGPHLWIVAAMHSLKIHLDPLGIKAFFLSFLGQMYTKKTVRFE